MYSPVYVKIDLHCHGGGQFFPASVDRISPKSLNITGYSPERRMGVKLKTTNNGESSYQEKHSSMGVLKKVKRRLGLSCKTI